LYEKRKDVIVLDKHLVRVENPPKGSRPKKLIPVPRREDKN